MQRHEEQQETEDGGAVAGLVGGGTQRDFFGDGRQGGRGGGQTVLVLGVVQAGDGAVVGVRVVGASARAVHRVRSDIPVNIRVVSSDAKHQAPLVSEPAGRSNRCVRWRLKNIPYNNL